MSKPTARHAYVDAEQVCTRYGFSISTLRRSWYDGTFPAPVRIGRRRIAWKIDDLIAFDEARKAYTPETAKVNRLPAEKREESFP